jgi:hypothetical protein
VAGTGLASCFVSQAVEAYGDRVLAEVGPGGGGPQTVGRELARLIFVRPGAGAGIPVPLAGVIGCPGSEDAERALETSIGDLLQADPALAAAVAEVLDRYYRQ